MATETPSLSLAAPSSADTSSADNMPLFDDYAMLTMLLRLVVILRNGNGDASIYGFTETADVAPDCAFQFKENEFTTLDAMSAILVQNHEIVAASYLGPDDGTDDDSTDDGIDGGTDNDSTTLVVKLDSDGDDEYGFPIEAYSKPTRPHLRFLIAANPRGTRGTSDKLQNLALQKITPFDGCWQEIQNDPLCRITHETSLEQHTSTVCAYLTDFTNNPEKRPEYSTSFFKYILSVSWPKIYRRIASWRGLGLIFKLSPSQSQFRSERYARWDEVKYDTRGEKYLVDVIFRYSNIIQGLMYANSIRPKEAESDWDPPAENLLHFDSLIAVVKSGAPQLYTKETADDFHRLIYASLVTCGRSLRRLGWAIKLKNQQLEYIFNALRAQVELLLFIITSTTFQKHVEVLCETEGLGINDLVPNYNERDAYEKFGVKMGILDRELITGRAQKNTPQPSGAGTAMPKPGHAGTSQATPESSHATGTSEATPESGDVGEMMGLGAASDAVGDTDDSALESELQAPPATLHATSFISWVKSILAQLIAKRVLDDQCRRPDASIEILLLSIDRVRYQVQSWRDCKKIIKDALIKYPRDPPVDIPMVLERIEKEIVQYRAGDPEAKPTVDIFKSIVKGRTGRTFTGAVHSETILATLASCCPVKDLEERDPEKGLELARVCQRMSKSIISVSKLCCPVCWEVMRSLRGTNMDSFVVRGCHSIAYATPLPPWVLSDSVVRQDVTSKVQRLLENQVCDWILAPPPVQQATPTFKPGHKPRQQSQTSMVYSIRSSQGSDDPQIQQIKVSTYKPEASDWQQ